MAELRRKAQEHSAALLQSLHAAAAAGLAFPGLHLPPFAMTATGRKSDFFPDMASLAHYHHQVHSSNNNNNSVTQENLEKLHQRESEKEDVCIKNGVGEEINGKITVTNGDTSD